MSSLFQKFQKFIFLNLVLRAIMFSPINATNCMKHTPFLEAKAPSVHQEIPCIVWNVKVNYIVYNIPPLFPVLGQLNSFHIIRSCF
jgi:hypothetical protein